MPNWCNNTMLVKGKPEDVRQFVEQMLSNEVKEGEKHLNPLDFESVLPIPRVLKTRGIRDRSDVERTYTWYDWSIENWGTKWNSNSTYCHYELNSDHASYNFDTAWSPAVEWQEKVIEYFPWLEFEFEWEEFNMNFCGTMKGVGGKVVDFTDEEISDERLDEVFSND